MAKYSIEDTTLNNIADAIREKTGDTATLTPLAMPAAIKAITGGGSGGGFNLDNCEVTSLSLIPLDYVGTDNCFWAEWQDYITSLDDIQILIYFSNKATMFYIKGICEKKDDSTLYVYREDNNTSQSTNIIEDTNNKWTLKFDKTYGLQIYGNTTLYSPSTGRSAIYLVTTKGAV